MGERFTIDWLALREPVDHRSRAADLLAPLGSWWRARRASRVVDLGSGAGSNLRYLAPYLGGGQHWRLVDRDARLLERAVHLGTGGLADRVRIEAVQGELIREGLEEASRADLVTASALLDLVSRTWIERLVKTCVDARAAVLFALTWDGVIQWQSLGGSTRDRKVARPPLAADARDDEFVWDAVREHQRRDKGLGPSLGPAAGRTAEQAFATAGYRTELTGSPWVVGPSPTFEERSLALALIKGWEHAAVEQHPAEARRVRAWRTRKSRAARTERFRLVIGHVDLLALPPP